MKKDDFEKMMEDWAAERARRPDDLSPSAELYRAAREMGARRFKPVSRARWVAVGAVAACLAVAAVAYVLSRGPSEPGGALSAGNFDVIGQREGFSRGGVDSKGGRSKAPMTGGKKGGGVERGGLSLLQLEMERRGEVEVTTVDLFSAGPGPFALTPRDNYRLVLAPADDRFVAIYQLTADGVLVRLLPNETYCPAQNPLVKGSTYYVPAEPKWLYLGEAPGADRIYVVSSPAPLSRLDARYTRYVTEGDPSKRRAELAGFLSLIDLYVQGHEPGASAWRLEVAHS